MYIPLTFCPAPLDPKKWNGNSKNGIGLKIWATYSLEEHSFVLQTLLFLDPIAPTTQAMV